MDVEIRTDDLKGKGVFSKRDFKEGDIIFEEDPLVCCQFSWNAAYQYKACDHCLKPLESAEENARRLTGNPGIILPHPECCTTNKTTITECSACGVQYCSLECQSNALSKYHQTLCLQTKDRICVHPLELLNETWKHVHYPPETSTILIIPRILATIYQAPNQEEMLAHFMQFCHRTVNEDANLVHKLLEDKFIGQISRLHELLVVAMPKDGIEQLLTFEAFQSLLALIGTNGQGVGTSAVSQWVAKSSDLTLNEEQKGQLDQFIDKLYADMDTQSGSFLNNEGVALYSLQSACNHNCVPNAEPSYLHNSSRLSLVALQDIEAGEEVCISYLDECSLERSRHSRQKQLMENYIFLCRCEKCEAQVHDDDVTSDEAEEMSD